MYEKAERKEILTERVKEIAGESVGPYLVGDNAYPRGPIPKEPGIG